MRCRKCGTQNPPNFTFCIFCNEKLEQGEEETNGYLVCSECGGCYELQEGENPEDFYDRCECGGKLVFYWYKEEFINGI